MATYPSPAPARGRLSASGPRRRGFGLLAAVLALLTVGELAWRAGALGLVGGTGPARAAGSTGPAHESGPGRPGGGAGPGAVGGVTAPAVTPVPGSLRADLQRLIGAGRPVYCGGGTKPLVALTFDDGPGPYTAKTLDILRRAHATATFFLVGKLVVEPMYAGLPRREAKLGALGDHTWNHVDLGGLSRDELRYEIGRTQREVARASGEPVRFFRPPLGRHGGAVDDVVRSARMVEVLWSVDSQDALGVKAWKVYRNAVDGLRPGAIVLLHENRGTTLRILPRLLREIRARGLRTVTIPQLLALDPPSAAQLRAGSCP